MFSTTKKLILLSYLFFPNYVFLQNKTPLVMINPAGHAKNVGRKLPFGEYERTVTFELAEKLQHALKDKYGIKVVLSRFIGEEIVDPLQNASFANRLGVDFYLSIHMYAQETAKPKVFMYHLMYDPMMDLARRFYDPLDFIPIHQAHFSNIYETKWRGNKIKEVLTSPENQKLFDFYGMFGIPFRPLCGILAPAIAIEIGIRQENAWRSLVDSLVESLKFLQEIEL
jgi:hypothetical protein